MHYLQDFQGNRLEAVHFGGYKFIMRTVKVANRHKLGQNIQQFIRKASNPEHLQPIHHFSFNSKHSESSELQITPFTPNRSEHDQEQERTFSRLNQKKNAFPAGSRLKVLLEKHNKTLSSRLFAEEGGSQLTLEQQSYKTHSSLARAIKQNKLGGKKQNSRELLTRKKIKELFNEAPSQLTLRSANPVLPVKEGGSKTSSFFYNGEKKPYDTIRVNNQLVIFDSLYSPKNQRMGRKNNELSFYRTLYK